MIFVVRTAERFEDDGKQEREVLRAVTRAGDIAYISVVARVSPTPLDARSKRKAQDPRTLFSTVPTISKTASSIISPSAL